MDFLEFIETVCEAVRQKMGKEYLVHVQEVIKNNAVHMSGLIITRDADGIAPAIYLEPFYDRMIEQGLEFEATVEELISVYEESSAHEEIDVSFFLEFEQVREQVFLKLINYEANKNMLALIPHKRFLDLALVPYCLIKNDTVGSGSILIYHTHLTQWKVSEEEILCLAEQNTRNGMGYQITPLRDLMLKLSGNEAAFEEMEETPPMYVLSNDSRFYGAVCMMYEDILQEFAKQEDCDFIILPSSIHEVLLVPGVSLYELDKFSQMVQEVNQSQVDKVDRLSEHAYYFKKNQGYQYADLSVMSL